MAEIYNVSKNVESVKKRLENSGLPKEMKDKIFEFVLTLREGSGIKQHREYYYYERLLILGETFGDKILDSKGRINPKEKDVLMVIGKLRDKITIRGTHYSSATISDLKKTMKKFVKFCFKKYNAELPKEEREDFPEFWNDIHSEKIGSRYKRPDQMISYEELQAILKACKNIRDKSIISLLWDSGIRASELLKLKIKDFSKSTDGLYAVLNISEGSKNYRQRSVVLTGDSVVIIPQYIEYLKDIQKDRFDQNNHLFVGIGKENLGESLTYEDLRALIRKSVNRAGITKQISPHLFRHSCATRLAVETPLQVFVKQMGWASNKMADNYTHLDKTGQITAILKAQGIEITDEELKKPLSKVNRKCPRCHVINTGSARFCSNCGSPMKQEDFVKIEEEREKVMETLQESDLLSPELKTTMNNLPDDSKLDLLASLLVELEKNGKLEDVKKRIKK
ncbi:MAG: site-specific integrase [Cuniculiplasma sp.]|jgi:site-specific recombinase XerD|nr:site-specific integrase [Cuniculiplasma sp.]